MDATQEDLGNPPVESSTDSDSGANSGAADAGWFPLAIGACVFAAMAVWRNGRQRLFAQLEASSVPLEPFLKSLFRSQGSQATQSPPRPGATLIGAAGGRRGTVPSRSCTGAAARWARCSPSTTSPTPSGAPSSCRSRRRASSTCCA